MPWQAIVMLAPVLPIIAISTAFVFVGVYFSVKETRLKRASLRDMRKLAQVARERNRALASGSGRRSCGT